MKVQDENSISRQKRAAQLPKQSKDDFLSLLGDSEDAKYLIYMTGTLEDDTNTSSLSSLFFTILPHFSGPTLYTLCTAVLDLDKQALRNFSCILNIFKRVQDVAVKARGCLLQLCILKGLIF
ncbi:hypothetical protein PVL29_001586 [Vitis rotundifolia]|uniref:Uncharacterized protein n=1 Tax=Vitis rotundifolia TaxID=103349 RepID=A0AA39AFH4_VITRO|nr:hypothetical protein PVL29_001586 [Vitis rotundifolia]